MREIQNKLNRVDAVLENIKLGFSDNIITDACSILIDVINSIDVDKLDCLNQYMCLQFTEVENDMIISDVKIDIKTFKLMYKAHIKTFNPNVDMIIKYLNKINNNILDFNKDQADVMMINLFELIDILKWLNNIDINMLTGWKKEARAYYDDRFYSKNDEAHRINHADDVYSTMLSINEKLKLQLNTDMIFMTAYCHDIFSSIARTHHHILARDYVVDRGDKFLHYFNYDERELIGKAVLEHRSSGSCKYSNDYSRAIKIADKGKPVLKDYVRRIYNYHDKSMSSSDILKSIVKHLEEKFGRLGYAFKCDYYREYYKDELNIFWRELDDLTIEKIEKIIW